MALLKINEIAQKLNLSEDDIEMYGKYKAKINPDVYERLKDKPNGKLVLVTAITPTKAGEGKTTISVGLAEGFGRIGKKALLCLREPSLGPVFGLKGGATGGGKASIAPSEDINLHFTGDMHALTSSINLISALIDNSIYQGNPLNIDPERIVWTRAMDMNDRALRDIEVAENDPKAIPHHSSFVITVASEMMAILCLAKSEDDFLKRIEKIIVAYSKDGNPITVKDLKATHAVMRLMKEALKPNLVQTIENNPVLVHGGPFANIAHGCNSILATQLSLKLSRITITEAGFGADLGAEKFLDIKCREGGFTPNCVVMVATIRALKMHGGMAFEDLANENVEALRKGVCNLQRHLENIKKFGVPVVVAINHFAQDAESEIAFLKKWCEENNYLYSFADVFAQGGEGAIDLANKVQYVLDNEQSSYHPLYDLKKPLKEKIAKICGEIYRTGSVVYEEKAEAQLKEYERLGFADAYICMAKTPSSFSDDASLLGAPEGFTMRIREVNLSAGANFVIPLTGKILTMPGLPKIPAAVKMEDLPW